MPDKTAQYPFTLDHPSLNGHFPGNPVIPGVIILDKVLATLSPENPSKAYKIVLAKFLHPLIPPAILTVQISETSEKRYEFRALIADTVVSNGIIEKLEK